MIEPRNQKGKRPSWVHRIKWYGDHREDIDCRVGSFLRPGRLVGRLPKPCG